MCVCRFCPEGSTKTLVGVCTEKCCCFRNKKKNVEISVRDADGIRAKILDKFTSVRDN